MGAHRRVDYRLLGPVEIVVDGVAHPLSGYRQELLLAALLLAGGREVPTDQLVELLWDGAPPRHPEAALRSQVARLRRAIGPDGVRLAFVARGYALARGGGGVDVEHFDELAEVACRADDEGALAAAEAALRLWRSPHLAFADRSVLQPAGMRLIERRTAVLERRAELLIRRQRAQEVVAELRACVLERPEHEGLLALLIEALDQSGRPTEALAVHRRWSDALRRRGLEPAPRLRELESRILRGDHPTAMGPGPSPSAATVGARLGSPTTFVGRGDEVDQLVRTLRERRVVTLVGPGGVGKTRLAGEVIRRVGEELGTLTEIDVAAVEDRADVVRLVAGAVGVKDTTGRRLLEQVVERLGDRRCLLLLDNCEHVIGDVAALVAALARGAPDATVLATSQRRLGVADERVWPVAPLSTAGGNSPAVKLFLDRARLASPHLALGARDTARIQQICAALDGLPLAIEIAAAQLSGLSLADLEVELDRRLELERPGPGAPTRHRTLRALIEWTYDRLDERERRALEQVCVFVGPFDLAAARAVLGGVIPEHQVAACIVQLVERSLLTFQTAGEHGHYRTLQSVRAFGIDRLRAAGSLFEAQAIHASWAVGTAEEAEATLADAERATVRRLDRCFDDLRAAHHWLVTFDAHSAMRLVHALHPYAFWHGRTEVFRWADAVAAQACASPLRASVQASVCAGAWIRGDLPAAELAADVALSFVAEPPSPSDRRALEQAAEIALQRGDAARAVSMYDRAHDLSLLVDDRMQATWDLGSSALILYYTGDLAAADRRAARARATANDVASPSARAFAEFVLGELAALRSPAQARARLENAVGLARSVGNDFIAGLARVTLASLQPDGGQDLQAAVQHYTAAVAGWAASGAWFAQLVTLRNVAGLLASNGAHEEAATLYGAVTSGALTGGPVYGADRAKLDRVCATLVRELGEARVAQLASIGGRLAPEEIIALALRALDGLSTRRRVGEPGDGPISAAG